MGVLSKLTITLFLLILLSCSFEPEKNQISDPSDWKQEVQTRIRTIQKRLKGLGIVIPKDFAPLITYQGPDFSFKIPERMKLKVDRENRLIFHDRENVFRLSLVWIDFLPLIHGNEIYAGTDILLLRELDVLANDVGGKVFYEKDLVENFALWKKETGPKIMRSELIDWKEKNIGNGTFVRLYLEQPGRLPVLGFTISWYSGTLKERRVFTLICLCLGKIKITPDKVMWPPFKKDPTFTLATLILGSFVDNKIK